MDNINIERIIVDFEVDKKILPFYSYLRAYIEKQKNQNFDMVNWILYVYLSIQLGCGYVYMNQKSSLEKFKRNVNIIDQYSKGMSVKQIAEGYDIGERQIRNIIHDAYRYLNKYDEDEDLFQTQYIKIKI